MNIIYAFIETDDALLGLEALKVFRLVVDPVRLRLYGVPGLLKSFGQKP